MARSRKPTRSVTFETFVRDVRPFEVVTLSDVKRHDVRVKGGLGQTIILSPRVVESVSFDAKLYCPECGGQRRHFSSGIGTTVDLRIGARLSLRCMDCKTHHPVIAVEFVLDGKAVDRVSAFKLGEYPPPGPELPKKLLQLAGDDEELLHKGDVCRAHQFGVGAFAYYRQFLERRKTKLFDLAIEVAEKEGADAQPLREAAQRYEFSAPFEDFKLPDVLRLPGGHNPFTMLHRHLSQGIHEHGTDEQCLSTASHVINVLTHLMERLVMLTEDQTKLIESVKFLQGRPPS